MSAALENLPKMDICANEQRTRENELRPIWQIANCCWNTIYLCERRVRQKLKAETKGNMQQFEADVCWTLPNAGLSLATSQVNWLQISDGLYSNSPDASFDRKCDYTMEWANEWTDGRSFFTGVYGESNPTTGAVFCLLMPPTKNLGENISNKEIPVFPTSAPYEMVSCIRSLQFSAKLQLPICRFANVKLELNV